jgi:hypothetical protein
MSGVFLTLLYLSLNNMHDVNGLIWNGLTIVTPLLAPLCIGIIAPLIVDKRSPSLIAEGLGMSLLVLAGIAMCGLIAAGQVDAATEAYCASPGNECHIGSYLATTTMFMYLAYGVILIIPGALIMGQVRKKRQAKREGKGERTLKSRSRWKRPETH